MTSKNLKDRDIVFIALFAALIAALGFIPALYVGFSVPITAQTLGVMLCGTILGSKRGVLAVLLFLLLVLIGLPLLSGGRGGYHVLFSGSGGFLIGWPVAAFVTGFIFERFREQSDLLIAIVASIIGGIVVLYPFGIVGWVINLDSTIIEASIGVLAFVPGDCIKAVVAGFITVALLNARPQGVLSRA